MKYIVLLCDGMADRPCEGLQNKTPMQAAHKPCMDRLAATAEVGMTYTVPEGMAPGSDVANLSVLGYRPQECYTGRSPLEAANIGVEMTDDDVAIRCNLVTLSDEENYADKTMVDYCAGDIHTAQADEIIRSLQEAFGGGEFDFYTGTAYRHCLVWHGGKTAIGTLTPPHDISGRSVKEYLPSHPDAQPLRELMEKSAALLRDHPINVKRREEGENPATSVWLWGHGKRPALQNFTERFGVKGAMVSAVDLLKGIARLGGMQLCEVKGATGYIDTDFVGKREAALDALRNGCDMVYIHIEAPDECGHRGELKNKVRAIEEIDRQVLAPLVEAMKDIDDFSLLIMPDHPTPLCIKTHSADPVPYLLYRTTGVENASGVSAFTEATAAATGVVTEVASDLMGRLVSVQ